MSFLLLVSLCFCLYLVCGLVVSAYFENRVQPRDDGNIWLYAKRICTWYMEIPALTCANSSAAWMFFVLFLGWTGWGG